MILSIEYLSMRGYFYGVGLLIYEDTRVLTDNEDTFIEYLPMRVLNYETQDTFY